MRTHVRSPISAVVFTSIACVLVSLTLGCAEDLNLYYDSPGHREFDNYTDDGHVVPQQPPSNALCSDNGWCWLHPTPSSRGITDLRVVDGDVLGTGRLPGDSRRSPMVWGDPIQVVEIPDEINASITRVVTSDNGWIAVGANNRLYEFDRDGVIDSAEFPSKDFDQIESVSADLFFGLYEGNEKGFLLRDGTVTEYPSLPEENDSKIRLWSDGTVWEISDDAEQARSLEESWRRFQTPPNGHNFVHIDVFGPAPTSKCGDAGIWAMSRRDVWRWNDSKKSWNKRVEGFPRADDFGCTADGHPVVADRDGGLNIFRGGGWQRKNVDPYLLDDVVSTDSTTYASGPVGSMLEVQDGQVRDLTRGFRLPPLGALSHPEHPFTDLWFSLDGKRGVLTHPSHFFHGSSDGWQTRLHEEVRVNSIDKHDEVWGIRQPEFAIKRGHLFRWSGSRWKTSGAGTFEENHGARDIDGRAEDDVWVITPDRVLHYDGNAWSDVIEPPSVESRHSVVLAEAGHDVLLAAGSSVYRVAGSADDRTLEERFETPCDVIHDMFRADSGNLYVAGEENCVAKRESGDWTFYGVTTGGPETGLLQEQTKFVGQPDADPPLLATQRGLFTLPADGRSERVLDEHLLDAAYVPERDAVVVLAEYGVLAKFF